MTRLINPVPQFLDGNGEPLADGLLYVYESGTNTLKDTFADVNLSIANTNPVELDAAGRLPNVFYEGVARLVLKDSDNVQVWEADNVGQGNIFEQFGLWRDFVIYDVNDIVYRDTLIYQSLVSGNQGNDPSDNPGNNPSWREIRFVGTYNAQDSYEAGDVVRTTIGNLWRSEAGGNQGNDPETDSGANWRPAVDGVKIVAVKNLEDRTTTALQQTGGGTLSALRVNVLKDSSTYTLPPASSVLANQWIDLETEDVNKAQTPLVQAGGSDTILWSIGTDTEILFDSGDSFAIRLYSDGANQWRI